MEFLYDPKVLLHNPNSNNEGAYRFHDINSNVLSKNIKINGENFLSEVHSFEHIQKVKNASKNKARFAYMQNNVDSYSAACLSVALTVEASRINGFALGRPPGHHASRDIADGFCLFNNIAIATKILTKNGAKVAIIDFDAHHGDGTQREIYGDSSVKYFSIHEENEWPFTGVLGWDKNCYNFPVPKNSGDDSLIEWGNRVQEGVENFSPDYIAVSAGFDGFLEDRISNLKFTQEGFYKLGEKIGQLERKTFITLEGGYHDKIYKCALDFAKGFDRG